MFSLDDLHLTSSLLYDVHKYTMYIIVYSVHSGFYSGGSNIWEYIQPTFWDAIDRLHGHSKNDGAVTSIKG